MITTIQNRLITPLLLTNPRQSLNNPQPQFLSLHFRINSYILNMSNATQPSQKFMFEEDTSGSDDLVGWFVYDAESEVCVWGRAEEVEAGLVGCETGVGDDC
jgi:hypothetical protein